MEIRNLELGIRKLKFGNLEGNRSGNEQITELAVVSEIRALTRAVEEGPHVVADAIVLARIGAAVILARTSNLDGDSAQADDVV